QSVGEGPRHSLSDGLRFARRLEAAQADHGLRTCECTQYSVARRRASQADMGAASGWRGGRSVAGLWHRLGDSRAAPLWPPWIGAAASVPGPFGLGRNAADYAFPGWGRHPEAAGLESGGRLYRLRLG